MTCFGIISVALAGLAGAAHAAAGGTLAVGHLRCEYLSNPQGIDVLQPRLSWVLSSKERGQEQTAYRVLVASSAASLAAGKADLWDSGKIASDQTIHVVYRGKPLRTRMQCFWKVQVWDANGKMSQSKEPAFWSMALLKPADWQAKWIAAPGHDERIMPHNGYHSEFADSPDTAKWVAIDLGEQRAIDAVVLHPARAYDWSSDIPGFLFPLRFKIEAALSPDFSDATIVVDRTIEDVPNPGLEAPVYRFDPVTVRYIRLVATRLTRHEGTRYGLALAEMQVLSGTQNVARHCSVTALDAIETGGWSKQRLVDGRVLPESGDPADRPSTMLRKEFELRGRVKRAVVSVTGLGLYELRVNGRKVGDQLLAPEWTRYSKRIQYQTYDVTKMLNSGNNAVGAQLSGGWWTGPVQIQIPPENPRQCLLMRMDIELADGTKQSIVTDATWSATTDGPIRRSGIYYGETYDATKEMHGWDEPGFAGTGWSQAQVLSNPEGCENATLVAQCNEPIRVVKELRPVSVTEPKPGVYVFDMGQNMVGWCRLKADAPAGTRITLRHGEMLNEDGTVYTENLRTAAQVNEYVWRGGEAALEPHFTYHGFRYVQVTGLPDRPGKDALLGRVFHSAAPDAGKLRCSNELINTIMHCVEWVQRANLESTPTDCPQRDERMGWMGDINAFAQTAIFNMDLAGFFTKWVPDIRDSQADDGRYPDFAPHMADPNTSFSGAPAWGDAGIVVPWRIYQNYADTRILEQHFESAKRWIEFIHSNNPNLLWQQNRGNDYNDWLNGDTLILEGYPRGISDIPHEVFATAMFAHSTEILAKMAALIGRQEDAERYSKLFEDIKAAFNQAYVKPDGRIHGDTQAGYALALNFNLLDEALRPKAMEHLIEAIGKYKDHPSTGMLATHRMMLELTRNGRHDEAWRLINLRTVPSWGYMVEMGATTIWERWDGYVKGRGFQNWGMNSFNHWAFGSVGEWVWRELAGINPDDDQPGYKHFVIRPRPCDGLSWVKAEYSSIRGKIVSDWKMGKRQFTLRISVPVGTTATVYVPARDAASVTESGKLTSQSRGTKFVKMEDGNAVFQVQSGQYKFEATVDS